MAWEYLPDKLKSRVVSEISASNKIRRSQLTLKKTKVTSIPYEHDEQVALFAWFEYQGILAFAIPNGSNKSKYQRHHFQEEGLKPGVPDLMVPIAKGLFHGLFIEMKRIKDSQTSDEQIAWHKLFTEQGYLVVHCKGAAAAMETVRAYLDLI